MPRRSLAALAVLTALGGALRLATVGVQSYWSDEAVTVALVRRGFGAMLAAIPHSESTPPLYYALAWLWARLFGTSEWGLRSLSVVFGTALIPLAYTIADRLGGRRAGLVAAALVAANPLLIWYSQEARAYAMLALLCAASLYCFVRVLEDGSPAWLGAWGLSSAAALATHYFALFPVAGEAAWLVLQRPRTRALLGAVVGVAAVGAALLPLAIAQSSDARAGFITDTPLAHRALQAAGQFLVGYRTPGQAVLGGVAAACAAVGLIGLARGPGLGRAAPIIAVLLAAAAVPFVIALAGADYVIARNLIAAWVPFGVLVALGTAGDTPRWTLAAPAVWCVLGLVAFVGVETHRPDQRDDWRGAARALGAPRRPRLIVSGTAAARVLRLYLPRARRVEEGAEPIVNEVDLVGVRSDVAGQPELATPRGTPPPGYAVAAQLHTPTYSIVRWRARAPRPLPVAAVVGAATDHSVHGLLYQGPAGARDG